ncbi:DNA polymerase delta catalytic subunit [Psilocybe cubensis]|nr:DNA polymerase delta catalytic subunit [Psilocybe cubensis]KAH9475065.1 DNA polymerase delta catalytic subunit [Psilocybe cubensis]
MTWLSLPAEKYEVVPKDKAISHCQLEVFASVNDIEISKPVRNRKYAALRIVSFDIETSLRFSNDSQIIQPNAQEDSVLQIGCMAANYGQTNPYLRTIFTLKSCSPIEGAQVLSYDNERELLMAFRNFVIEVDPDVVTGYNIAQFDIPFLLNRADALEIPEFPYLGRVKNSPQRLSGLPRNYLWNCPAFTGRLLLDIYFFIRNSKKFEGKGNSTLNAISRVFLGEEKESVDYKQIPKLQDGTDSDRRTIAIYCLKDVYLALRLLPKINCLEQDVEAARTACIPFNAMRGKSYLIRVAQECRSQLNSIR